jgi:hypothetical protein
VKRAWFFLNGCQPRGLVPGAVKFGQYVETPPILGPSFDRLVDYKFKFPISFDYGPLYEPTRFIGPMPGNEVAGLGRDPGMHRHLCLYLHIHAITKSTPSSVGA